MCVCSILVVLLVVLVLLFLIMLVVLVIVMSMLIVLVFVFAFMFILFIQRNINSNIISYHRFILSRCFRNLMEAMRREALLCEAGTGHVRCMRPLYMHMGCIVLLLLAYFQRREMGMGRSLL